MTIHNIPHNPVAANTLFHFTSSIDNIENILTNEFLPKYCLEDRKSIYPQNLKECFAYPMVCFCDIPLSQIRNHISKYGNYGIGLMKTWGIQNRITPVFYMHHQSDTLAIYANTMMSEMNKCAENFINPHNNRTLAGLSLLQRYLKPYEGRMWDKLNNNFQDNVLNFYEEREWRFIPNTDSKNISRALLYEKFIKDSFRRFEEEKLKLCKLSFEPEDIRYIIVNKEDEIPQMIEKIKAIKAKYSTEKQDLLITRIISMEHILADF